MRSLVLLVVGWMSLFVSGAAADKTIAVLPIEGDKKEELVLDLRDMLVDAYTLASQREVSKIYDLLKGDGLSIEDMENIAARTRADYVIDGKLVISRSNRELTLWVRDTTGVAVKKLFVTYKGQLGDAAKAELGAALREAIDAIGRPSGGRSGRGRDDASADDAADSDRRGWGSKGRDRDTERDRRSARDDEDDPDARDVRDRRDARDRRDDRDRRRDDDLRDDRDDRDYDDDDRSSRRRRDRGRDDEDDRDREPAEPSKPRELDKFWAAAQFAVLNRSLTFTGFRAGLAEQPGGYKGSIVPGVKAEFEAFPMAGKSGFGGALGVYGTFERALVINVRSSQAAGTKLATTLQQYDAGVLARFRMGKSATIQAGVGYGVRSFVVDRSPLGADQTLDLPDVTYKYVDPSVGVGFGLGKKAALTIGGRFFLVLSAGAIQTPQEYGRSTITGGQGELGLNIYATNRVLIRISGAAATFGFDFEPGAQQTNGRDGDLATQDIGGARDLFISAGAGVGIRF